ncbi:hypothetical protein UCREL1_7756 [Eutypa lata UCREL1]|uniref:Arylsulfotransferase protein n=1 Tax=Eutypa lata (strain UCR-EL1) TaxID=1287681 RepID=M7T616_EUTLA|nr:hypothetical protein UCREL1_7756 [Eutypa lata UCREL1]
MSQSVCRPQVAVAPFGVLSDRPALLNDYGFDQEAYGVHPMQKFRSVNLEAPLLNIIQSSPKCEQSLYTMMAPRGLMAGMPQITVLDQQGHLVWTTTWKDQQLYNLMVQEYKGEKYITFWGGDDTVGGHGAGKAFMLDKNYEVFKEIEAANGRKADLHDFRITAEGTALLTVYELYDRDLSEVGQDHEGPVWDCMIQEIDIETGDLLFEWRAMMFYPLGSTYTDYDEGVNSMGWDYFHLNSIDKDSRGNYLVSSRYMHSLTYIDGRSGEVLWILGGKMNMFEDLSGGNATNFQFQHDARWSPDEKTITVFDNGVDDLHRDAGPTRGLRVQLDERNMTARVVTEYINPHHFHAKSQGSLQELPNGNVLLGYGDSAAFTEFSHDGATLCDTHFAPESRYMMSDVQSYRVYKFEWHGWPTNKPDAVLTLDQNLKWSAFVSWNGATEISKWVLQGSKFPNATSQQWQDLDTAVKTEFETGFELKYWYPTYLRLVAKDSKYQILGFSETLNSTEVGQVST